MKNLKLILAVLSLYACSLFGQSSTTSFTSTAPFGNLDNRQIYNAIRMTTNTAISGTVSVSDNSTLTAISNTLNALYNKIDTTTKVVTFNIYPTVTYSANCAVLGTLTVKSLSIDLGSQYWSLENAFWLDAGGNYGLSQRVFLLNDTISATDNTIPTATNTRSRKVIGMLSQGTAITSTSPAVVQWALIGGSTLDNRGAFTGVIYFYFQAVNVNNSGSQQFRYRFQFRKIKD